MRAAPHYEFETNIRRATPCGESIKTVPSPLSAPLTAISARSGGPFLRLRLWYTEHAAQGRRHGADAICRRVFQPR